MQTGGPTSRDSDLGTAPDVGAVQREHGVLAARRIVLDRRNARKVMNATADVHGSRDRHPVAVAQQRVGGHLGVFVEEPDGSGVPGCLGHA